MNKHKQNVLFVTTSYPRFESDIAGSFQKVLVDELVNHFNITVIAPDDIAVQAENKSIKRFTYFFHKNFHKLTYGSGIPENLSNNLFTAFQFPFLFLSVLLSIHKYCNNKNLIISNWLLPCGLCGAIISAITKKPHIIIEHSAGIYWLNKLPFKKVISHFIIKHSTIIFVSPHLKNIFDSITGKKLDNTAVIPMGIDINQFNIVISVKEEKYKQNIPLKNKVILFTGRLETVKGLDILIQALKDIENITLLVAGNGSKKNIYETLSKENNIDARFLGIQTGLKKIILFNLCDLVVVPSIEMSNGRTEGAPVVIMEAFASGKPVIGANTGGIPFMVKDNTNGKLFKPSDHKELHNLLKHIFQEKHFYYKLSEEAKTSALNYDNKKIARRYTEVIKQIIK